MLKLPDTCRGRRLVMLAVAVLGCIAGAAAGAFLARDAGAELSRSHMGGYTYGEPEAAQAAWGLAGLRPSELLSSSRAGRRRCS
jgi:hypothetical protein